MLGWSRTDWIFSSRVNWPTMFSYLIMDFGTVFNAQTKPVTLCLMLPTFLLDYLDCAELPVSQLLAFHEVGDPEF